MGWGDDGWGLPEWGGEDVFEDVLGALGWGLGQVGEGGWGGGIGFVSAKDLLVFSGLDGPQLILNWTFPFVLPDEGAPTKMWILRKEREYPRSIDDQDAVIVYVGDPEFTEFADHTRNTRKIGPNPTDDTWYYYRIFTELEKEGAGPVFDINGGGSEGFDLAYESDAFVEFVKWDLLPDVWWATAETTSQDIPVPYTDPDTDERLVLVDRKVVEGMPIRLLETLVSRVMRRAFAYAGDIHRHMELQRVRADAIPHLGWMLQSRLDETKPFNDQRRNLMDSVYQHRLKGRYDWLQLYIEQLVPGVVAGHLPGPGRPAATIEMHNRVMYAWNPQEPATVDAGVYMYSAPFVGDLAALAKIEKKDDPFTWAWCGHPQSPYNERGWRLYWDADQQALFLPLGEGGPIVLFEDVRQRLIQELWYAKPLTVAVEIWEGGAFSAGTDLKGWAQEPEEVPGLNSQLLGPMNLGQW